MFARMLAFKSERILPLPELSLRRAFSFLLALTGIGAAAWFCVQEKAELGNLNSLLRSASPSWMLAGVALTVVYVFLQGYMYLFSMRAAGAAVTLPEGVILFLKRNFASLFLPAGGFVSLGMFTRAIEKRGVARAALHFGSSVYALLGLASLIAVAIPVLLYLLFIKSLGTGEVIGFVWVAIFVAAPGWLLWSLKNGGTANLILRKAAPGLGDLVDELQERPFNAPDVLRAFVVSVGIEVVGMLHLWMAMRAFGMQGNWEAAVVGYVVAMLVMVVSPFLRGLGGVELAMTFALTRFGLGAGAALSVTLLFRFFEFWLVLAAGVASFLRGAGGLMERLMPPVFLLALGLVNVVSAVTPALPGRMHVLKDFLPLDWIHYSNFLVLTAGLILLLTSVYLLRGLRLAWWVAAGLTAFSAIGHFAKGFDFEEAALGLVTLAALVRTKKQYFIKIDRRKGWLGGLVFGATLGLAVLYGTLGFYFLDKKMFGLDFTLEQSFDSTLRLFFLLDASYLQPLTAFARHFMTSIAFAGMLSILMGLYYLLLPHIIQFGDHTENLEEARHLVWKYGQSGLDYFKTYFDKQIFFNVRRNAFIAYKIAKSYAVVLEKPVAPDGNVRREILDEFEVFCRESGLKPVYYRVPETDLGIFGKRKVLRIGQEAIADVSSFSLEGGDMKPLRNAVHRAKKEGMRFRVYEAPVRKGVLQKCKAVSDAWLAAGRSEVAFTGGVFSFEELRGQTLLTVEDAEECVVAFVNLIPDYAPGEATYDLMRRLPDAPGWVADFLMVNLLLHLQNNGYQRLNLGFAPMGDKDTGNLLERTLQLAYSKVRSLAHYRGLRSFKEKYADEWQNRYLVYASDADLLVMPGVLATVVKA